MENSCWVWEQKTLISELIQGMEMAKQLKEELNATSSNEISRELLVKGILSSYEKALMILQWSGSTAHRPQSPNLINGSPQTEEFDIGVEDYQEHREGSKKRKMMPKWTEQVRLISENGLEWPHDDGHNWRKYGQKDILGAKFPRSYYRCTYRNSQKCWATKQVQRSDENDVIFEITYRGKHTCSNGGQTNPPLPSPEKKNSDDTLLQHQYYTESRPIFCFPSSSFGCEEIQSNGLALSSLDDFSLFNSFPQPLVFPTTLQSSSRFSPCQKSVNLEAQTVQRSESDLPEIVGAQKVQKSKSDLTEIFSANTSSTNSPILDLDFSLDSVLQIDPNFPFVSHGYFS